MTDAAPPVKAMTQLKSDCSRCAALCCIAYPAEEGPGFAASKQAGEPCPNLDQCGLCTIYHRRVETGFGGCEQYECFGAGQRVVQDVFKGRTWIDDPAILSPMLETFLIVRKAHELLFLVERARTSGRDLPELDPLQSTVESIAARPETRDARQLLARCEATLKALFERIGKAAFLKE